MIRSARGSCVALYTVVALAFPVAGCETLSPVTCDTSVAGNPPAEYAGGAVSGGVYLSSPWDGPLLWLPGGAGYHLEHQLGVTPRWVSLWVSFSEDGAAGGGELARASANEAILLGVGPTTIAVQNAGCQDFWLLVGAGTGATQPSPP